MPEFQTIKDFIPGAIGEYQWDDVVWLGEHNGQTLSAKVKAYPHLRGMVVFGLPGMEESGLRCHELMKILFDCPETTGNHYKSYHRSEGSKQSMLDGSQTVIIFASCPLWDKLNKGNLTDDRYRL